MPKQRFEYIVEQNPIPQFKLEHVIKQHVQSFQLDITPINDTLSSLSLSFTSDETTRLSIYYDLEQFFRDNNWWYALPATKIPDEWYLQELDQNVTIIVEEINEILAEEDGEVFRGNINEFQKNFSQELAEINLPNPRTPEHCITFCRNYGYKVAFSSPNDLK